MTLTGNSFAGIMPDDSGTTALDSQRAALIADSATQDLNRSSDFTIQPGRQFDNLSLLSDLEDESRIEIVSGGTVEFQGGSLTLANGGQVAVSAVKRVQVDTGATIDVSGLVNVQLPMSANEIAVSVEGNELRDDPDNRDTGTLFNDTLYVDDRYLTYLPAGTGGDANARYYTPGGLLEVSGWLSNTAHTIGEVDGDRRLDHLLDRRQWLGGDAAGLGVQSQRRLGRLPKRLSQCELSARQRRASLHGG